MRKMVYLFIVVVFLAPAMVMLIGCQGCGRVDPDSPFAQYGGEKVEEPTPPEKFTLSQPNDGASFRPGDPIPCVLEVVVKDREHLPTILRVALVKVVDQPSTRSGTSSLRISYGTKYPTLTGEPSGEAYTYKTEFEAPQDPGRYEIRANATDYVKTGNGPDVPSETVETGSDAVPITVDPK